MHALVTAMAKAAEDRACTKAASRVPETKNICDIHNIRDDKLTPGCLIQCVPPGERTLVHHSAEYVDPTRGGRTVPPAVPELVLALSDIKTEVSRIHVNRSVKI